MRTLLYPAVLLLAVGCSGNTYNQDPKLDSGDLDTGSDTDDTDTDDTDDTGDTQDTDTGAVDTGDTQDTDDTGDTQDTGDTDTGSSSMCTHAWDPLDQSGYSREYDVSVGGSAGTGLQESDGLGWTNSGIQAYLMWDEVTSSTLGWKGDIYIGCDVDGDPGLYMVEWYMDLSLGTVSGIPTSPRKYLPPETDVGNGSTWTYAYTTDVDMGFGFPMTMSVTGTYEDRGFEDVTLFDGNTYTALHIRNDYTMDMGTGTPTVGTLDQWYVEGLGLVRELNVDSAGSEVMTRELTRYYGLTPR